jgi:hypothetical protein
MKMARKIKSVRVKDLPNDLMLVDRDYDVQAIKDSLGKRADDFSAFFVKVKNGEYIEVWGIENNIPYNTEIAYKIL